MKKEFKISYIYDPLNRLSAVEFNGEAKKHYDYDEAGNLTVISPGSPKNNEAPAAGRESKIVTDEHFAALEEQYHRLNAETQSGAISPEQFQERVNELRFQDAAGVWWQLRFDGIWLKWDGAGWVEAGENHIL